MTFGAIGDFSNYWIADALTDNATLTSNTSISLDTIAACEVGIALY
ncbi:hypothetical protein LCGC14_3070750, partial [marine sediment metagenome]